jgi:lipopolysaccharide transport system permease protein
MSMRSIIASGKLIYTRDLLLTLVARDIKLRYKRSIMGIAWSLVTPLAQLAVFYLIFRVLLPVQVPNYMSFLFSGILVWSWFQMSLFQATTSVVDNRELIKRPGFPSAILPSITIATNLIHFLIALPILFVLVLFDGHLLTSAVLALPLVIAVQFIFTLSLAYFSATFYVSFRDTQYLLGVILNLMFFLTPIFYETNALPAKYQAIFRLNPMVQILEFYRAILFSGKPPEGQALLGLTVPAVGLLLLGYYFFKKTSDHFVNEL